MKRFSAKHHWRILPLIILLSSTLLLGLSACGKKGPLYQASPEDNSQQKLSQKEIR